MKNLLFAEAGESIMSIIVIVILVALLVVMLVMNNKKRAQYMQELQENQKKFVVGAKVKTYAGFYGEIVAIREALDGTKVITIKIGEGSNAINMDIDMNFIASIDDKDNKEKYDEEYNELVKKVEENISKMDDESSKVVLDEEKTINENTENEKTIEEKEDNKENTKESQTDKKKTSKSKK